MKHVTLIIRMLMGLVLLVIGLNKFLHFLPMPSMQGAAADYFGGLIASGFTIPAIAVVEIATGLSLLLNRFVPLALVIMAPVSVNILLYHLFLDLEGLPLGGAVFAFNLILLIANKKTYQPLLSA